MLFCRFTAGGEELGGRWFDVALPVLAGEHRAATLTLVGCRRGSPGDPLTLCLT
jgi:hypothetical protein